MKGSRFIKIGLPKISFEVVLERKVTVLKGKSATGKTTFVDLIEQKVGKKRNSGIISLSSNAKLIVLRVGDNWKEILSENSECIIISDEGNEVIETLEFAEYVKKSNNYFLFVTRSGILRNLTYAIDSIIEFSTEKKGSVYITKSYNKYTRNGLRVKPNLLITEDKGTGFEMMSLLANGFKVISGCGKDNVKNIYNKVRGTNDIIDILVDGAAFGSCIGAFDVVMNRVNIIAPESFEYLLLNTDLLYRFVKDEVDNTIDFCEFSENILTYENYYYQLLRRVLLERCKVAYTKSKLPNILKSDSVLASIKKQLPNIDFD